MKHTLPCKFCKRTVEVTADDNCPPEWQAVLLKFVACNKCADYRSAANARIRNIRKVCLNYIQLHNAKELTPELQQQTRTLLVTLTKSVAEIAARFHGIAVVWEPDFVQQLFDKPEKAEAIVHTYLRMLGKLRTTQ